jgi:hypothetical protein
MQITRSSLDTNPAAAGRHAAIARVHEGRIRLRL